MNTPADYLATGWHAYSTSAALRRRRLGRRRAALRPQRLLRRRAVLLAGGALDVRVLLIPLLLLRRLQAAHEVSALRAPPQPLR
jgi:hypothetical protein